jgi:3D (Asp-Asp-Asp) domain-containing protein
MRLAQLSAWCLLSLLSGKVFASSCAPGLVGCDPTEELQVDESATLQALTAAPTGCSLSGVWTDAFGATFTVNGDLTGTRQQPYCNSPHTFIITAQDATCFSFRGIYTGGSDCVSFTEDMCFQTCDTATGTFSNDGGGSGAETWTGTNSTAVSIVGDPPTIPSASRVQAKRVLTHSDLTLTVSSNGQPASGVSVSLQSDRSTNDVINGPSAPTDSAGTTTADVETRDQPGPSTISSADPMIRTATPAVITWLPAAYESSFLVTCYVVSVESTFASSPLIGPVTGLPATNRYRSGFINDVRLQGSGIAQDGTTIHYDGNGRFSVQNCPLTATGACAVDGTTIAVDRSIVPYRSTVAIDTVGSRAAQDTGGAITGYHIDEYFGTRRADCIRAGRRNLDVTFTSY